MSTGFSSTLTPITFVHAATAAAASAPAGVAFPLGTRNCIKFALITSGIRAGTTEHQTPNTNQQSADTTEQPPTRYTHNFPFA